MNVTTGKRSRRDGFTLVEVLISSGILLPLLGLVLLMLATVFWTAGKEVIRNQNSSSVIVILDKISEAANHSSKSGLSYTSEILAVQPMEGLRDDGKLYWEKKLELFWWSSQKIFYGNIDEQALRAVGLDFKESEPLSLSSPDLVRLTKSLPGRVLAEPLSAFRVSFQDQTDQLIVEIQQEGEAQVYAREIWFEL